MPTQEAFLTLVRMGLGLNTAKQDVFTAHVDWGEIQALALEQGLSAIVLDGIEKLPEEKRPPRIALLEWIGEVMQTEDEYAAQQKAAIKMSELFQQNEIRTYVLKGRVIAECYPKPKHRSSADLDCFLIQDSESMVGQDRHWEAWEKGNLLIEKAGYEVSRDFYKNSTFYLPELTVENHRFMVPFRGNETLKNLERVLQSYMRDDHGKDKLEGTELYRPPVMVSALFLIEHAYSHFLHEGLTWRHVLDWMMFSKKHKDDIEWYVLDTLIDEYGFRKFYDSYYRLGKYLLGEIKEFNGLSVQDKRMLADIWAPLDLHETVRDFKGKLALAGNTLRAWWKYKYFAPISMPHALWIQVKGFLFERHPKLD